MAGRSVNLLAASLLGEEQSRSAEVLYRLNKSGSIWEPLHMSNIPDSDVNEVIRAIGPNGEKLVSHRELGLAELMSAAWLRRRAAAGAGYPVPLIPRHGLTTEQETAARMLLSEPISCLSGLPGTGKTHTMRAVYESLRAHGLEVALTAFTGAAASRLGESVGGPGMTLHRLLEYKRGMFGRNDKAKLDEYQAVIVDEAGMLSTVLLWCLLRALPDDCLLILVGDPYQLPSVEPGYVLGDLAEVFPHARLTTILRSDPQGPIGLATLAILSGEVPRNIEGPGTGFYQISYEDDATLYRKGTQVHKRMAEVHDITVPDVRVMASTNIAVKLYNDICLSTYHGPTPYIATRNNADAGYYNGDRGYLEGDMIRFESGIIDKVSKGLHAVAFATTVWKQQGREATACMLLLPNRHGVGVPKRSEVYTAITRAKARLVVLGNLGFFARAIRKTEVRRLTLLRELIERKAEVLQ